MTYKEQFEKAQKAKKMNVLTPKFIQFEEEGGEVIGKYISTNVVEKGGKEKNYCQYIFDTDTGLVKFHLGSVADGEFGNRFQIEHVYYIRYDGKDSIGGGKSVNKFFCAEIGSA